MTDSTGATRRTFLACCGALAGAALLPRFAAAAPLDLDDLERRRVLPAARRYLKEKPVTITAFRCPRSAGGQHDYYSEGDYWWPDPKNPDGPYIRRDGMSNPANFDAHRHALIRLSVQEAALAAAWKLSRDRRFAEHAARHLRAWFLDPATRMNPDLRYAQAIHGITQGRGIGIIDTIHLVEVVQSIPVLIEAGVLSTSEQEGLRAWFRDYLRWMTTSKNGIDERNAKNNHGTCWVMQAAEFARFAGDDALVQFCRDRYRTVLLPHQMAADGSFPLEVRRTKPYGYSLFNLDAMATVCQILSDKDHDLFAFRLPDGRCLKKGIEFMAPYIADKKKWPHPPDVMYFADWPVRQVSLFFGGRAYHRPEWLALWARLDSHPTVEEILRNKPIRQPVLWV